MTASTPMGNWTSAAVATTANSSGERAVLSRDTDDAAVTHHEIITQASAVSRDGQGVPGVNVINALSTSAFFFNASALVKILTSILPLYLKN